MLVLLLFNTTDNAPMLISIQHFFPTSKFLTSPPKLHKSGRFNGKFSWQRIRKIVVSNQWPLSSVNMRTVTPQRPNRKVILERLLKWLFLKMKKKTWECFSSLSCVDNFFERIRQHPSSDTKPNLSGNNGLLICRELGPEMPLHPIISMSLRLT